MLIIQETPVDDETRQTPLKAVRIETECGQIDVIAIGYAANVEHWLQRHGIADAIRGQRRAIDTIVDDELDSTRGKRRYGDATEGSLIAQICMCQ